MTRRQAFVALCASVVCWAAVVAVGRGVPGDPAGAVTSILMAGGLYWSRPVEPGRARDLFTFGAAMALMVWALDMALIALGMGYRPDPCPTVCL